VPGAGETPNLMLGLAGIGYFYLRLADSSKHRSVLMILPSFAGDQVESSAV
jgi:lantibiotic modifying enzyme